MGKISLIFCLVVFSHLADCYIRLRPDPFLSSSKCDPATNTRHFVEDPQFCDRVLICPENHGFSYVMYCPERMVYNKATENCVELTEGKEYCDSRGVLAYETPRKPTSHCSVLPIHSEPLRFVRTGDGDYLKMAPSTRHGYFLCKKGMNRPALFECYHPDRPDVILDSDGERKCFPKGALRQYLLDQNEKDLPGIAQATLFKPEARIVTFKGLPIRFNKDNYPICPKNEEVRKRFGFGIASRIRHSDDCIHFWTCSLDNIPRKHSCPYTMVFDAEKERCIFYKEGESPCNQAYDFESKNILDGYKMLHNLESLGQELQNKDLLTLAQEFRVKLEYLKRTPPGSFEYDLALAALYDDDFFQDGSSDKSKAPSYHEIMEHHGKSPKRLLANHDLVEKKLNVSAFNAPGSGNAKTEKLDE